MEKWQWNRFFFENFSVALLVTILTVLYT